MITNAKITYVEQQALELQMGVFVWLGSTSEHSFISPSPKNRQEPSYSHHLYFPGRFLLQLLFTIEWCCCGTAEAAVLCLLIYILHLRFFDRNSSSLNSWPLPARPASWGFCCWITGSKVKSDCFLLFWMRSVQNCKVGLTEIGMPTLASLDVLRPWFQYAPLQRCKTDSLSVVENSSTTVVVWLWFLGGEGLIQPFLHYRSNQ